MVHPVTASFEENTPNVTMTSYMAAGTSPSPLADHSVPDDVIYNNESALNISDAPRIKLYFYQKEQIGFLIFLFVGILVGNAIVLFAIALSKRGHKSRMTFFIMHLAIADLLVGFVTVLVDLLWKVTVFWYAGNVMCHMVRYMQGVAMFASTYVLVALSIDRLEAIARPMSFTSSKVRARVLVSVAWVLSAILALPLAVLNHEVDVTGGKQCGMNLYSYWKLYVTLLALAVFIIPAFIIGMCYCVIIYVIWKKSKVLTASGRSESSGAPFIKRFSSKPKHATLRPDTPEGRSESTSSSRGVIPQAKIRTVKMTLVIVIVFIMCWSPYFVYNMVQVYARPRRSQAAVALSVLIQSLAPLNSLANPLIYGVFSSRICSHLGRVRWINWVLNRCCCWCPPEYRTDHSGSMYTSAAHSHTYTTHTSLTDDATRRQSRHKRQGNKTVTITSDQQGIMLHSLQNGTGTQPAGQRV